MWDVDELIKVVDEFTKKDFVVKMEMSYRTWNRIKGQSVVEYVDSGQVSPYSMEVFIRNDLALHEVKCIYKSGKSETIILESNESN